MTLAVILVSISLAGSAAPLPAAAMSQDATQAVTPSNPATNNPQDQGSTPPAQNPSAASKPASPTSGAGQAPSTQNPPPAKRPPHKKKVIPSNCTPANAVPSDPSTGSAPSSSEPPKASAGGSTSTPGAASAPANCPPSKIIVRHGGTSEPPIQLAGGPAGDQAAQQRNTNQMLTATQQNLKRIAGRTLTANQQDMVKQVHQFMEQSKAASATGDTDRARMLAWKAQLLSEELTNPLK